MSERGKLIGIVGYKGAGKSSITDAALDQLPFFVRRGFADPMCKMLIAMGLPEHMVNDKKHWDTPLVILQGKTIRHAAVTLGTEWGRAHIGQHVWTDITIDGTIDDRNSGLNVIIDNIRFPSEFEKMQANGCVDFIAFHRPGILIDLSHESEKHIALLQRQCNWSFLNNGSFGKMVEEMRDLLLDVIS